MIKPFSAEITIKFDDDVINPTERICMEGLILDALKKVGGIVDVEIKRNRDESLLVFHTGKRK